MKRAWRRSSNLTSSTGSTHSFTETFGRKTSVGSPVHNKGDRGGVSFASKPSISSPLHSESNMESNDGLDFGKKRSISQSISDARRVMFGDQGNSSKRLGIT